MTSHPKYYSQASQEARRLARIGDNHRVLGVTPASVSRVYDLSVRGEWTHNFVCEGLVAHNCFEYLCVNLFLGAPTAYREERRELVRHRRHQLQRRHGVVSF